MNLSPFFLFCSGKISLRWLFCFLRTRQATAVSFELFLPLKWTILMTHKSKKLYCSLYKKDIRLRSDFSKIGL